MFNVYYNTVDSAGGAAAPATQTNAAPAATQPASTAQTPAAAPSAPAAGEWFSSFKDQAVKDYVIQRGFKDPEMVAHSYLNLEKLMGAPKDQILKLPTDAASAEWEQVFQRIGKPEKPDGYKLEPKEGLIDKEFTEWAKNAFHKANLTAAQAEAVMGQYGELLQGQIQKQTEAQEAEIMQNHEQLKTAWGNAYDQKLNIAKAGAKEFGLTVEQIDGIEKQIGHTKTMELFHNIGSKLGEAQFTSGNSPSSGSMTPDVARAHLSAKQADSAFMARYVNGDAAAKAEMNKLFADAYPGQMSIG